MGSHVMVPWAGLAAGGAVLALGGFAVGSTVNQQAKPTSTPQATAATASVQGVSPTRAYDIPGDGTYVVGPQVKPGTYVSLGGSNCYWARLADTSGGADSIIANGNPRGQVIVTVDAGDVAFTTQGCGGWMGAH